MATSSDYFIWSTWTATSTSTASTTNDVVWSSWTSSDATSWTSTSTVFKGNQDRVWKTWTSDSTDTVIYNQEAFNRADRYSNVVSPWKDNRTTEEKRAQKAQREIEREWRRIKAQELKEEKEQAELTAQDLLKDLIDEEQMRIYKETGNLVVYGEKYDYVLRRAGGVVRVEKGKVHPFVCKLCIHLQDKYKFPETDNVIALKLFLETDEKEFNYTANELPEVTDSGRREEVLSLIEHKRRAS